MVLQHVINKPFGIKPCINHTMRKNIYNVVIANEAVIDLDAPIKKLVFVKKSLWHIGMSFMFLFYIPYNGLRKKLRIYFILWHDQVSYSASTICYLVQLEYTSVLSSIPQAAFHLSR